MVLKGHCQFENINFTHQFLAKGIPTINNAENPTQSMNLIGENFFIYTDQYIIPDLTPRLKMDCCSKVARYLEALGNRIFM